MSKVLTFAKEVTYILENENIPEDKEYIARLYHFVDNVENRRYWISNQLSGIPGKDGEITALNTPEPLPYKGTGKEHEEIKAPLVASETYERLDGYGYNIKMIFELPDISKYIYVGFSNDYDEDIGFNRFEHLN